MSVHNNSILIIRGKSTVVRYFLIEQLNNDKNTIMLSNTFLENLTIPNKGVALLVLAEVLNYWTGEDREVFFESNNQTHKNNNSNHFLII